MQIRQQVTGNREQQKQLLPIGFWLWRNKEGKSSTRICRLRPIQQKLAPLKKVALD